MTMAVRSTCNYTGNYMEAIGDSANDVFVATSEYGIRYTDFGVQYIGELSWVIDGGAANDTLFGLDGADILRGDDGDDGNDELWGDVQGSFQRNEAGNDTLVGGAGADKMHGGNGSDVYYVDNAGDVVDESGQHFVPHPYDNGGTWFDGCTGIDTSKFNATSESATIAFDVIQDFVKGADKIDLSTIDANSLMVGNQAFNFNAAKPFFTSAGDLWVEQGRGFSSVYVDVNGDGNADMRIDGMGTMTLTAADFSL